MLRHWEQAGLLVADRDAFDRRRYREEHLSQVALILLGKEAGFTLGQLRRLLSTSSPMDEPELLREHARDLERRIVQAQAAKELIEHALSCPLDFHECEHAQQRIAARIPAR
ncbi:hypothetical protein GCM10010403_06630 [Glycomyces rutgersensis]|uniref:HTH merR-type domain-containing protein n=1 Tax=Glycomyces rutgersensis TaxID=58115 RepID=A0ABN3F751_9ACTN